MIADILGVQKWISMDSRYVYDINWSSVWWTEIQKNLTPCTFSTISHGKLQLNCREIAQLKVRSDENPKTRCFRQCLGLNTILKFKVLFTERSSIAILSTQCACAACKRKIRISYANATLNSFCACNCEIFWPHSNINLAATIWHQYSSIENIALNLMS